jgi:hypothetical protein
LATLTRWAPNLLSYFSTAGTERNYRSVVSLFVDFCQNYGFNPLDPTQQCLTLFITFMSHRFISSGTVLNYFSLVRKFLRNNGVSDHITFSFHTKQMLRASRVFMRRLPSKAPPLHISHVRSIIELATRMWPRSHSWFVVAITFSFFGFFRLSSLAPLSVSSFDPLRDICRQDIFSSPGRLQILIKWSKTDQDMRHSWISKLFQIPNDRACPVSAFLAHCADFPTVRNNQPFLLKKMGNASVPVVQLDLSKRLSDCITVLGLDKGYTWHSLRRGAVHAAVHSGATKEQIMSWGGWRSDAVLTYFPRV